MRTTQTLRDRMEKAAAESGRSLAQEVEYRMERSFRDDEVFGSIENRIIAQVLTNAAQGIELKTGQSWLEDWDTYLAVDQACRTILKLYGPKPPGFLGSLPGDVKIDSKKLGVEEALSAVKKELSHQELVMALVAATNPETAPSNEEGE